jgi:hypothetical protein
MRHFILREGALMLRILKKSSLSLIGLICFVPAIVKAQSSTLRPYAPIECPRIPAAYGTVLEQLTTLKSQIQNSAHCEGVRIEVGELENLVRSDRRTRFLDIVRNNADRTLSPSDTEFLQRYSTEVSDASLRLMAVFRGQNNCFPESERATSLAALTTVVHEASSLISQVAGPYGAPIAIGGTILTGVLQGIQAFENARPGYRFDRPAERRAFTEQLCLYHLYRQQLDELLYPEVRLNDLRSLQNHLATKIEELRANCSECAEIITRFSRADVDRNSPEVERLVEAANQKFQTPLGTETTNALRTRTWVVGEIERIDRLRALSSRSIGPQEIYFLRSDLDDFFFRRQAPAFLQWQLEQALRSDYRFQAHAESWTREVLRRWETTERGIPPVRPSAPLEERVNALNNLLQSQRNPDVLAFIESQSAQSRDLFQLAWSAFGVIEEYCNFFRESRSLSNELRRRCETEAMDMQRTRLSSRAAYQIFSRPNLAGPQPPNWSPNNPPIKNRPEARTWGEALASEFRAWEENPARFAPR